MLLMVWCDMVRCKKSPTQNAILICMSRPETNSQGFLSSEARNADPCVHARKQVLQLLPPPLTKTKKIAERLCEDLKDTISWEQRLPSLAPLGGVDDLITQREQQLGETPLRRSVVPKDATESRIPEGFGEALPQRLSGPGVVAESQKAPDDMFQEPHRLLLDELVDHVRQHGADGVEALVGLADVLQPEVVEEDLLHDEDGDCFGELGAGLHDPQAEGDDLGCEEEVDYFAAVVFDEGADHAEGGQAQVFKRAGLGGCVEEGVEEEGDVGCDGISESSNGGRGFGRNVPPRKRPRVSLWLATHWRRARALQTRFEAAAVSCEGLSRG